LNLEECFQRRLLRKERPDPQKAERSLQVSTAKLEQAQKSYTHQLYDACLVLAYTSMFHAARSILFRDGIVEKSHVCLVEYLRHEYSRKGLISEGFVNSLDRMRIDRHEAIYGLETSVTRDQANHAIMQSREFIEAVKRLISINKTPV
jgi:uncharacterized protein (UPF0332 family)